MAAEFEAAKPTLPAEQQKNVDELVKAVRAHQGNTRSLVDLVYERTAQILDADVEAAEKLAYSVRFGNLGSLVHVFHARDFVSGGVRKSDEMIGNIVKFRITLNSARSSSRSAKNFH